MSFKEQIYETLKRKFKTDNELNAKCELIWRKENEALLMIENMGNSLGRDHALQYLAYKELLKEMDSWN